MKFKGFIAIALIAAMLIAGGCRDTNSDDNTTSPQNATTTSTTFRYTEATTTTRPDAGNVSTTVNSQTQTTVPGTTATTNISDIVTPTRDTSALTMTEVSVYGLPVIVGNSKNRMRISAAGVLNGNYGNPMYLLVTNIGDDDIFSATITATAGGQEITFNISFLPRGGSVWAESLEYYKYNADEKFVVDTSSVIVSSGDAGVSIDRNYQGLLKIYAGERNGGKGLFVENISGKKMGTVVVRYRPVSSGAGLYSAPLELVLNNFENGATAFKANSYVHDAMVVDVQITY